MSTDNLFNKSDLPKNQESNDEEAVAKNFLNKLILKGYYKLWFSFSS